MGNILERQHSKSSSTSTSKSADTIKMEMDSKSIPAMITTTTTKSNTKRSMSHDTVEKFQKEIDELQRQFDRLNRLENKQRQQRRRRNSLPANRYRNEYSSQLFYEMADHSNTNNNNFNEFQCQINELEKQLNMLDAIK
ncbi:hypothetical protein HUG17_3916 [Dermatophagoides farinae]|uniref:Uncharacterized protein n=1 Tax=Dermatophagoides farinae TaxID=6954 RepID=A0A9D4NWX9_DERFA|nr:hypothetical protein HUG17_3916 [Dermatophagoides farinae]